MQLIKAIYFHLQKCSKNSIYSENQRNSFLNASECIEMILDNKIDLEFNCSLEQLWEQHIKKQQLINKIEDNEDRKSEKKITWLQFLILIEQRGFFKGCAKYGSEYRKRLNKAQMKYKIRYPEVTFTKEKESARLNKKEETISLKKEGNNHLKKGELKQSLKFYSEAIKINFNDPILFANRSACYNKLKSFEEAILDAQEAIRIDPNYIKAYNRLASSYKSAGQIKEAIEVYRKVMKLSDDNKIFTYCNEQIRNLRKDNNLEKEKVHRKTNNFTIDTNKYNIDSLLKSPSILQLAHSFISNPNFVSKMNKIMKDPKKINEIFNKFSSNT